MQRKKIKILFIWGIVLVLLGIIPLLFLNGLIQSSCPNRVCTSPPASAVLVLMLAVVLNVAGYVLLIIAWIGMLRKQAKEQQWRWFVCTLLFSFFCMLIYLIMVPETPLAYVPRYQQSLQHLFSWLIEKKTIVILFSLSIALFVVAIIGLVVVNMPALSCSPNGISVEPMKSSGCLTGTIVIAASYFTSIILGLIVLVGSLVKQAKQGQWVWFGFTLFLGFIPLLGGIFILIYLIAVREAAPYIASAYVPRYQQALQQQSSSPIWTKDE